MYNKQNNENSDNMTIDISIKIWFILQVLLNVKFIMASFNQKMLFIMSKKIWSPVKTCQLSLTER